MCLRRQAAYENPPDERLGQRVPRHEIIAVHAAADRVGVHAGAADVFADLIDDQQVDFVERQRRHHRRRLGAKLRLSPGNRVGRKHLDASRVVHRILDNGHAAEDRCPRKNHLGQAHQRRLVAERERGRVVRRGTGVFA